MKKTFPLTLPGKDAQRVVEAVKLEVRKYMKRERRKRPPEGVDGWDFNCRVGPDAATAVGQPVSVLIPAIEEAAKAGAPAIYIEILAAPHIRPKSPALSPEAAQAPEADTPPPPAL
ncbi:MAG: hypothetical protein HZA31_11510 [Opitutae bacterium]|nr:hypothetical protein [Opitutae bacterium]